MKISNKQKQEIRKKIIHSAVEIITEKGFKSTSMKNISQKAGIADATIYNYFPTKESILYGYYHLSLETTIEHLKEVETFNQFTLQEQMQLFLETSLTVYTNDREFVQKTFQLTFLSATSVLHDISPIRKTCIAVFHDLLEAATEVNEIPEQAGQDLIEHLLFDYYFGIVLYWLKDTSEQFTQTTLLIDKTLAIIIALLKSDITSKLFDLFSYLFKTHVLSNFESIKETAETFTKVKRNFMGDD